MTADTTEGYPGVTVMLDTTPASACAVLVVGRDRMKPPNAQASQQELAQSRMIGDGPESIRGILRPWSHWRITVCDRTLVAQRWPVAVAVVCTAAAIALAGTGWWLGWRAGQLEAARGWMWYERLPGGGWHKRHNPKLVLNLSASDLLFEPEKSSGGLRVP